MIDLIANAAVFVAVVVAFVACVLYLAYVGAMLYAAVRRTP